MLTWQAHPEWRGRKNFQPIEPLEETRQHYANIRIAEFQRSQCELRFSELLHAFRYFGMVYDQGFRLRQSEEAAA